MRPRPEQREAPRFHIRGATRATTQLTRLVYDDRLDTIHHTRLCRADCALACPLRSWAHLLDDDPKLAPIRWRLAWALHGLPDPLPRDEWRDAFAAVAEVYGAQAVVDGLREAATIPTTGRQPFTRGELSVIADAIQRRARGVAP